MSLPETAGEESFRICGLFQVSLLHPRDLGDHGFQLLFSKESGCLACWGLNLSWNKSSLC